jgi:hypothetical protein
VNPTTYNSTNVNPIEQAIEELNSHDYPGKTSYQAMAGEYGVVDTTLRRRRRAETQPREVKYRQQQLLTPEQENELVKWIDSEMQGKQPPAARLVASRAEILAGKPVGSNWVY